MKDKDDEKVVTTLENVCTLMSRTSIINGVIWDSDDESGVGSLGSHREEDIGYEFIYSLPDDENETDEFVYNFDTFRPSSAVDIKVSSSEQLHPASSKGDASRRVTFTSGDQVEEPLVRIKSATTGQSAQKPDLNKSHEPKEKPQRRPLSAGVIDEQEHINQIPGNTATGVCRKHNNDARTNVETCSGYQTATRPSALLMRRSNSMDPEREQTTSHPATSALRKSSTVSRASKVSREDSKSRRISTCRSIASSHGVGDMGARKKSVCFDPELDKASAFIHGGGQNFSRASTSLTPPMKHGLSRLQVSYTETNLERNQSIIFLDLLRDSHKRSMVRDFEIKNIERRLKLKRDNPLFATSFYEHKQLPDPFQRRTKKCARTVAQKKKERKEKIKKLTDEIHTGYEPTYLTMKIADKAEVEDIGRKCRYLRCKQPSLDDQSRPV